MTSTLDTSTGDNSSTGSTPRPLSPTVISPSLGRRTTYSTPLEAVRRRQEALERLAARRVIAPSPPGHRGTHLRPITEPASHTSSASAQNHTPVPLTSREVEVLRTWLLTDSKSVAARRLVISVGTVNTHLARIRAKYADAGRPARTKAALVARAIQDGMVKLDEL